MKIQLTNNGGGKFEPAPEGSGKGVCVDITSLKEVDTPYGKKLKFRFVFELDKAAFGEREDGRAFCVWSAGFVPSSHVDSGLTKFLKQWLGKDFPQRLEVFDVETLLGRPAFISVTHSVSERDGKTVYANIQECRPDESGAPLVPSGKFVREQDRKKKGERWGDGAPSRKVEVPAEVGAPEWGKVVVHVGKNSGVELGQLSEENFLRLYENWIPVAFSEWKKPTEADKRLRAALEAGKQFYDSLKTPGGDAEEDVPF